MEKYLTHRRHGCFILKALKIAIVKTTLLSGSGQVVYIKEIANRLTTMGHKVVVYSRAVKATMNEIETVKLSIPLGNIPFIRHFTFSAASSQALKNVDIVHTQYHPSIFAGSVAKSIHSKPHVFTYHGFAPINLWREPRQKLKMIDHRIGTFFALRNQVDKIISVSKYLAKELVDRYLVSPSLIKVVYNGVDLKRFNPAVDSTNVKKKFNIGKVPLILYIGRLAPYKGVQFLLEAIPLIRREHPDAKIIVGGAPRYDSPLIGRLIKKEEIRKAVVFTGYIRDDELSQYYGACDVFCFPSMWEGFGLPMAEAQACGKPVVAFDHCAMPEVISNGETGILVNRGDSLELAEAINRLLGDESLRLKMSRNARLRTERLFDWNLAADATLRVYQEVLQK